MHTYLIEMLECPACQGKLEWRITEAGEAQPTPAGTLLEGARIDRLPAADSSSKSDCYKQADMERRLFRKER